MSDQITHAKVTKTEMEEDGTKTVTIESYFDKLAHRSVAIEKHLPTNRQNILKDIITCIEPILGDAIEVDLKIKKKHGQPSEIIWGVTTLKESFNRR